MRTTGGATRGVALGAGVGVGVGVRAVPGRLKCSSPGIVCGAVLCASAAPEVPSSNVSVSARHMVELTKIPTNSPYPEKPERHTTGLRRATSRATRAMERKPGPPLERETGPGATKTMPLVQARSGTPSSSADTSSNIWARSVGMAVIVSPSSLTLIRNDAAVWPSPPPGSG